MKKQIVQLAMISTVFFSGGALLAAQAVPDVPAEGSNQAVVEQQVQTYHSSDTLATGDPLGNHAMTPKDNAGPLITQKLNYDDTCQHEACQRAFKRWGMPTTWQQDRATGLSK